MQRLSLEEFREKLNGNKIREISNPEMLKGGYDNWYGDTASEYG